MMINVDWYGQNSQEERVYQYVASVIVSLEGHSHGCLDETKD